MDSIRLPDEGELYRVYTVEGHTFEIRYGYYREEERGRVEPVPVFPDLKTRPMYSPSGQPIVTLIQLPCEHYQPRDREQPDHWCGDCTHYRSDCEIGVCEHSLRRRKSGTA